MSEQAAGWEAAARRAFDAALLAGNPARVTRAAMGGQTEQVMRMRKCAKLTKALRPPERPREMGKGQSSAAAT